MDDRARSRVSPKGERKRQEILDTAREILVNEGWEAFSMREVAARVSIRHGHLQYYFPTKQDLLIALYDAEVSAYTAGIEEAVTKASSSRAASIEAILDSGIATAQRPETELWRLASALASRDEEMASILARDNQVYRDALVASFEDLAPELSRKQRLLLARFVQVVVDGASLQLLTDDASSSEIRGLLRLLKRVTVELLEDGSAEGSASLLR